MNNNIALLEKQKAQVALQDHFFRPSYEQGSLPQEVITNLIDGVLILTEKKELIYANDCAHRLLRQLNRGLALSNQIPEEVWHICQALIDSRHLLVNQYWLIESKIFVDNSIFFNVRANWLRLKDREQPCLLLSIRDQCEYIKDVVDEESQKYGLTSREKEIWLLHRANYTYKQIALELCISGNTVKKHMKSIYSKRKTLLETQDF
jgi:DNA-binding CsgD family transcriptional regulator